MSVHLIILRTNAQVEMKMQNLGKADQLVWQASCTARLTLWKKK